MGTVIKLSLKQKLNVEISTKMGIVGEHYGLSVVLWSKHFIEYQGYNLKHKKL